MAAPSEDIIAARTEAARLRAVNEIQASPDPTVVYSASSSHAFTGGTSSSASGEEVIPVRRPNLGLTPRELSWATLEVISLVNGQPVEIFNSCYPQGMGKGTTNFFLQSVQAGMADATQVIKSLGDFYLSDVSREPHTLSIQAVLFESLNFPWLREWLHNWNHYLSSKRCILNRTVIHLTVDGITWVGYMMRSSFQRAAQGVWEVAPFAFEFIVRDVIDADESSLLTADSTRSPIEVLYTDAFHGELSPQKLADMAFASELERNFRGERLPLDSELTLEEPRGEADLTWELQIPRLIDIARALNAQAGYDAYNIGDVRRGLQTLQNSALEYRGLSSPYGTPSGQQAYADKVNAQVNQAVDSTQAWAVRNVGAATGWW